MREGHAAGHALCGRPSGGEDAVRARRGRDGGGRSRGVPPAGSRNKDRGLSFTAAAVAVLETPHTQRRPHAGRAERPGGRSASEPRQPDEMAR